jgi:OmpA-OmpF porin, OOP family
VGLIVKIKNLKFIITLFVIAVNYSFPQLAKDSWSLTVGGAYPRFVNHALNYATNLNYGGFIGLQRNFSEHVALRFEPKIVSMELAYGTPSQFSRTFSLSGNFDFLYYPVPCEPVSPYISFGAAPTMYFLSNQENKTLASNYFTYQFNGAIGIEWTIENDWKLKTEFQYVTVMDGKFDGSDKVLNGGIMGGEYNSYFSIDIGINYYFSKGEASNLCQIYNGLKPETTEKIDYDKIETIVKKYIPKEVIKQVVVEKPVLSGERWVMVGVNFEFNSAKLLPESYPILFYAIQTLMKNPEMNVEIEGYTDSMGSDQFNKNLSEKRANSVRDYLIAQGVNGARLKAVGYGETKPVADNNTAEGRALNRRIEFKIIK